MTDAASRMLAKLRGFVDSCDDDERAVLAVLLAPGLTAMADTTTAGADEDDVQGYAMPTWQTQNLAEALTAAVTRAKSRPAPPRRSDDSPGGASPR